MKGAAKGHDGGKRQKKCVQQKTFFIGKSCDNRSMDMDMDLL